MLDSISLFICKYLGAGLVYVGEMVRVLTRSFLGDFNAGSSLISLKKGRFCILDTSAIFRELILCFGADHQETLSRLRLCRLSR